MIEKISSQHDHGDCLDGVQGSESEVPGSKIGEAIRRHACRNRDVVGVSSHEANSSYAYVRPITRSCTHDPYWLRTLDWALPLECRANCARRVRLFGFIAAGWSSAKDSPFTQELLRKASVALAGAFSIASQIGAPSMTPAVGHSSLTPTPPPEVASNPQNRAEPSEPNDAEPSSSPGRKHRADHPRHTRSRLIQLNGVTSTVDVSFSLSGHDLSDHVVLLDERGRPNGTMPKAFVHHEGTPFHPAFSYHVVRSEGKVLLTRRSPSKRTWPGIWSNACCGHPRLGESLSEAIQRHLLFELGASARRLTMAIEHFTYRAEMANRVVEHEWCPVVIAETDGPLGDC